MKKFLFLLIYFFSVTDVVCVAADMADAGGAVSMSSASYLANEASVAGAADMVGAGGAVSMSSASYLANEMSVAGAADMADAGGAISMSSALYLANEASVAGAADATADVTADMAGATGTSGVAGTTSKYKSGYRTKVPFIYKENPSHFHWGFLLGVSVMDFSIKLNDKNLSWNDTLYSLGHKFMPGFTVGIICNFRLHKYFDLRIIPSLSLAERALTYNMVAPDGGFFVDRKKIESVLIEVPLDIKWKAARMMNNRPYVVAGIRYTGDLAALGKKKNVGEDDDYEMKIFRNDLGFSLGVGWEFYMPYNNKICLELKMYFGLRDLLNRDNNIYCNGIERMTSRILQFNIMFENN